MRLRPRMTISLKPFFIETISLPKRIFGRLILTFLVYAAFLNFFVKNKKNV